MFREKMRAFVILALSLMLAAAPVVAETTVEQRLADLETVRTGLEEGHYDLFALVTPDEWQASLETAAEKLRDENGGSGQNSVRTVSGDNVKPVDRRHAAQRGIAQLSYHQIIHQVNRTGDQLLNHQRNGNAERQLVKLTVADKL